MAGEAPIGTIVAHGGGDFTPENEEHSGWLLCDGRVFSVSEQPNLFDAIGFTWGGDGSSSFNLPDLVGYFLRGFDARERVAVDGDRRTENNPGGATGNAVGTVQEYATALPQGSNFIAEPGGAHIHPMNFQTNARRDVDDQPNTVAFPAPNPSNLTWPSTAAGGHHEHRILGAIKRQDPIMPT